MNTKWMTINWIAHFLYYQWTACILWYNHTICVSWLTKALRQGRDLPFIFARIPRTPVMHICQIITCEWFRKESREKDQPFDLYFSLEYLIKSVQSSGPCLTCDHALPIKDLLQVDLTSLLASGGGFLSCKATKRATKSLSHAILNRTKDFFLESLSLLYIWSVYIFHGKEGMIIIFKYPLPHI